MVENDHVVGIWEGHEDGGCRRNDEKRRTERAPVSSCSNESRRPLAPLPLGLLSKQSRSTPPKGQAKSSRKADRQTDRILDTPTVGGASTALPSMGHEDQLCLPARPTHTGGFTCFEPPVRVDHPGAKAPARPHTQPAAWRGFVRSPPSSSAALCPPPLASQLLYLL